MNTPSYGAVVLSRCTSRKNYEKDPCDGIYYDDGTMTGGCGDPCSFCMQKAGSGDPPFLHESDLLVELRHLLKRQSRGPHT